MALNIGDLLKEDNRYSRINTNIGELCVFSITAMHHEELLKSIGGAIKNSDPLDYLKKLIPFVCFLIQDLKDGEFKPDSPLLTLEVVNELSSEALENIAEVYVLDNEYLFKKRVSLKRKDSEGNDVHYSELKEVEHHREDEETYVYYLYRLSCLWEERMVNTIQSHFNSIPNINSFSNSLSGGIVKNLMLGDSISKAIKIGGALDKHIKIGESFGQLLKEGGVMSKHDFEPEPSSFSAIDLAKNNIEKEKARLKSIGNINDNLQQLISISTQTSEFMIDANKIQTQIATEIKAGGDTTDIHARQNIKLSVVIIIITVFSVLISGWSIFSGLYFSKGQQKIFDHYASNFSETIISNSEKISNESQLASQETLLLLKQINHTLQFNQKNVIELSNQVNLLKDSNKEYKIKIKELSTKLNKIKNQNIN